MLITLDHETYPIDRGALAPRIVCTSWCVDDGEAQLALWRDTPASEWTSHCYDGANTAYDLTCQMAADHSLAWPIAQAYLEGRVRDVILDAKLAAIARGESLDRSFGLAALAAQCGYQLQKDGGWRMRYGELDGIDVRHWPHAAREYSLDDTRATRAVRRSLGDVAGQPAHICQLGAGADWALHLASCWGVCTDPVRVERLAQQTAAHIDELRRELVGAGLLRPSGTPDDILAYMRDSRAEAKARKCSVDIVRWEWSQQGRYLPDGKRVDAAAVERMAQVMSDTGRADKIKRTPTGEVCLDRDAAILSGDELLVKRADYLTSSMLLGRVERLRQGTTIPLQTRFDSCKVTFRTSSSQPRPPLIGEQMQNFPSNLGLRETFTPRRADWTYIGADIGQAELCALAELCYELFGFSALGDMINARIDVHWTFAAARLGISYDEVRKLGKKVRNGAKAFIFGLSGGMGCDTFRLAARKNYGLNVSESEFHEAKAVYLRTLPEMKPYFAYIASLSADGPFTHTHPRTGYLRGDCGYTDGANHGFQHLTGVAVKDGLLHVTAAMLNPTSPLYGYRVWNMVHDEILIEGPADVDRASAAAIELARVMETRYNHWTPRCHTRVEPWVSRIWSKENSTVYDQQGRVVDCVQNRPER